MKHCYFLPLFGCLLAGPALAQTPVTFGAMAAYSTGSNGYPTSVVVADVNGDGKPDALVANESASTLAVLLGNGNGSFTLQANSSSTGSTPGASSVAVADVNGDGKPDALVTNRNDRTLAVLLGNGSGGFALQATQLSSGANSLPGYVVVADVNGDGKPDVLAANGGDSTLGVWLGNGSGSFALQVASSTGTNSSPGSVAVADVNGDGKPDALVANTSNSTLGVLLGNGSGSFALQSPVPSTGANSTPRSVAVADMNGDGKPDALVANAFSKTLGVLVGTGSGTFTLQANQPSTGAGSSPYSVAVADVNGDGKPDALVANAGTGTLGVFLNTTTLPTLTALPGASATLAPNPAHASATLTATNLPAAARTLEATLLNPVGQVVRRFTVPATAGAATATIPTAGLAPGLYLLRLDALDAQGAALGALPVQRLAVE